MAPRPVLLSNALEDTWANPDGRLESFEWGWANGKRLGWFAQTCLWVSMQEPLRHAGRPVLPVPASHAPRLIP